MSTFVHILRTCLYLALSYADGTKIYFKTAAIEHNLTELFLRVLLCGLQVLVIEISETLKLLLVVK